MTKSQDHHKWRHLQMKKCDVGKPFPKQQILDSFRHKGFPDDNSECDKNGGEFSKRLENTVGKGDIAHYMQFLHFPQSCTANTLKHFKEGRRNWLSECSPFTYCVFRCFHSKGKQRFNDRNFYLVQIESICRQQIKWL